MTDNLVPIKQVNEVEVRGFSYLKKIFDQRNWPFPVYIKLTDECSAVELAKMMDLPLEKIEAVFINGLAKPLEDGWVKPGDRVAFVPPGTPGPYRALLGLTKIPGENNN
ncbi:thiamine S protein [Desulfolucanica intricata]|uniref:thiamine S protein n=1 Tax=Desulfolucanica intricata TaxID=1285191 RepID=UPI00082E182C|nr:thiamine S protein [Desulfolucanica intricata]